MVGDTAQQAGLDSRAAVIAALRNRTDALVNRFEAALKDEIPLYRELVDPGFDEITRDASRTAILAFADWLEIPDDEDRLDAASRDYFVAAAESSAAQFMPLSALEDPVRVGCRMLRRWAVEACADTPEGRTAAIEVIGRLADFESFVGRILTDAYVEERYHPDIEERELQRDLIETLIDGRPLDRHGLTMLAGSFGLATNDPCVVAVGQVRSADAPPLREVIDIGRRGQQGRRVLVSDRADDIVGVISAAGFPESRHRVVAAVQEWVRQLHRVHQIEMTVGISTPGLLSDVPERYAEARKAMEFLTPEDQGVIDMSSVGLFTYLTSRLDPTARRLVPRAFAQMLDEDRSSGGVFAETLVAFADADLNVGRTASNLYVHANTVHYRLKRIAELTGRNPKHFRDLVDLLIAVEASSGEVAEGRGRG